MQTLQRGSLCTSLFIVVGLATCAVSLITYRDVLNEEWAEYKARYGKTYSDKSEDNFRFKIFLENRHKIARHNQRQANGQTGYSLGLNKYSDMSHKEIVETLNGYKPKLRYNRLSSLEGNKNNEIKRHLSDLDNDDLELPKEVDWRRHGAVSPVKDQGRCGSCWAFSSTGALEGHHYLKSGNLISLSEQNLVDCSGKYGNIGCNGGLMENAFTYIRDNHGLDTENSYPYEGHDDKCRFRNKTVGASDKGYVDIPSGNERKLMQAVALKGPVSVAIDASQDSFHLYKDGVYNEPKCGNAEDTLDHGVLVIGYGTDAIHGDYWLVKNSWAETWGQSGYIKMARNKDNQCGIATSACYPVV